MTWTSDRARLAALGLGAVALIVPLYLANRPQPGPAAPVAAAEPPPPSGDNVAPEVHARLMVLRQAAATDDPAAQVALARFLQDAHHDAEAAEAYEAVLTQTPDDRQSWLDLTNAYGAAGDWASAADAADRMAERFPGDGTALYNAGAAFANAGQVEVARARFEAAAGASDPAMATQARTSLVRLAALGSAPTSVVTSSQAAPPLSPGRQLGPLPPGHPPIPAAPCEGTDCAEEGVAAQVVTVGRTAADPDQIRAVLARQPPLSARSN